MSSAAERSLLIGSQIGRNIFDPINSYLDEKTKMQFEKEMYQQRLADTLKQLGITNPEISSGIVSQPVSYQNQGQDVVKALPVTPQQLKEIGPDGMGQTDNSGYITLGGMTFDPAKIRQAKLDEETRKTWSKILENQALYNARPQLSTIIDPTTGEVSIIDKKTREASPVTTGSGDQAKVGVKIPTIKLIGDDGRMHLYQYQNGEKGKDLGLADSLKGQVVTDQNTGAVYIVNPQLPQGVGPGQSTQATEGGSTTVQPSSNDNTTNPITPFRVTPKPNAVQVQIQKEERQLDDAFDTLNQLHDLYKNIASEGAVGPVAGRLTNAANFLTGGGYNPDAATYRSLKEGFTARIKALSGDVGVMTDQDQARIGQLIADIDKDPSHAENNFKEIKQIVLNAKFRRQNKTQPQSQGDDMVSVIAPDGTPGKIPAANLQKAIQRGYKQAQ